MIEFYGKNEKGHDYIFGDIHGCLQAFHDLLDEVCFDTDNDRAFLLGDVIDRGSQSAEMAEVFLEPWCFSVRGNHEQMFIDWCLGTFPHDAYMYNGGQWANDLPQHHRMAFMEAFQELPLVIELETEHGRFGLVHGECRFAYWDVFKKEIKAHDTEQMAAMWSRDRITNNFDGLVKGVERIYVGHTPVLNPVQLGNHFYIDTGCVGGKKLTCLDVTNDRYVSVNYWKD